MHYWGDDWFENNGNDLYNAIDFIETYLHKHHISVCGKEKYGTYRDEFLHFWDGGLYQILFSYRCYIGTWNFKKYPKIQKCVNKIHHFIYYTLDCGTPKSTEGESFEDYSKKYENRKWKGVQHYSKKIGLLDLVHKYQAYHYNKAFQLACKKWPNVIDELICDINGYKMIKPCKWGNVDGEEIHKKYWKVI